MSRIDELIREHCPNGVEYQALGDVVTIRNGKDHKVLGAGDVPVYGSGGIIRHVDTAAAHGPTVLIPRKGSLGNIFYVDGPFWVVDTIFRTEVDSARMEPKFLYYKLLTMGLGEMNQAGGVPSQTQTALNRLRVPVPPLEVQREIVRILDQFTQLEAELEAELEARARQYAHYRDQLILEAGAAAPLGLPLAELAGDGYFGDGDWVESKDQDPSGDVRLTQLADVGVGEFRYRSDRWMRQDQASRLNCTLLKPGDILIARMPEPLGRACQVPDGIGAAATVVDVAVLRSSRSDVVPRYVMHALNSHPVRKQMLALQSGGTRQRISRTNLGKILVPLPTLHEQLRIAKVLDELDEIVHGFDTGLPAELVARRKQYEYYRDKLLTFEEALA